jgi:eukaryotic-like serine/threonine-protein kinase
MQRTHFGKYEVVELIGRGGFGQVFKGVDPDLKRPVAIKTCSLEQADMRERFFKEAEIAARLQHPSITIVYDFGKVDGEPYLVQEYLPGEDLDQIIKRQDPIALGDKVRFLLQIADGLRYAHSRGVVHRDVKPANMRILGDGQLRIMDFGIARVMEETQRLTQTGMTIGTAGFLSPEQLQGLEIDGRSDIFSFGVLAYELVTYEVPFKADSISALFYAIAYVDPPSVREIWPECPPALAACLTRCLEKDRDARYHDFSEVMDDLRRVLAELETGGTAGAEMAATAVAEAWTGGAGPGAVAQSEASPDGGAVGGGTGGGTGTGGRAAAASPSREVGARRRRGKRILGGIGVAAILVAAFEVLRFAMPGGSSPTGREGFTGPSEGASTPSVEAGAPLATGDAPDAGAAPGQVESGGPSRAADAEPSTSAAAEDVPTETAGAPPPSGQGDPARFPTPTEVSQPVSPATAAVVATPERSELPGATAEPASPYRGTTTLILLWSEGGDPASAVTAENAFIEEFTRRGMAVVEVGLLQGIHGDAAAMAMARGLDADAVATLGQRYGAEVVVVGSIRTEAEPSVGQFFTGRAVLDLRTYSASASELLGALTRQVGTGGTPGKLGPSRLAAETEAAREVGRLAAVEVAREFGDRLPRR